MRATTDIRNLPVKLTAEELETRSRAPAQLAQWIGMPASTTEESVS